MQIGDMGFPIPDTREYRELLERVERLERLLLSPPTECGHVFPLWMVIPPGGCWVDCPICQVPRFLNGPSGTW